MLDYRGCNQPLADPSGLSHAANPGVQSTTPNTPWTSRDYRADQLQLQELLKRHQLGQPAPPVSPAVDPPRTSLSSEESSTWGTWARSRVSETPITWEEYWERTRLPGETTNSARPTVHDISQSPQPTPPTRLSPRTCDRLIRITSQQTVPAPEPPAPAVDILLKRLLPYQAHLTIV